jgi:ribosomal-protein-alanine N-acetyltransferase
VCVYLRTPTPQDRAEFTTAMRASRTFHSPWMTGVCTDEDYHGLLRRVADDAFDPNFVCRHDDGAIVGFFNLSQIVRGPLQSAYLGYGAVAAHAGQGYMTQGMQLLLARAFGVLGLHRVEANIQPANERSLALAMRSGFVREGFSERYLKVGGRWRDHERWAIRIEQWHPSPHRTEAQLPAGTQLRRQ